MATLVAVILCLVGSDDTAQFDCQVSLVHHLSIVYVRLHRSRSSGREHHPMREPFPGYARSECLISVW